MRKNPLSVRPATLDDAEALAKLAGQLGYPTTPEEARDRLAMLLEQQDHAVYLAEDESGEVVGWVHVHGALSLVSDPTPELGGLVVDEAHRASGVGSALVVRAEAWARQHGYVRMVVRSNTLRAVAPIFYPALGYRLGKTQNVFVKDLTSS